MVSSGCAFLPERTVYVYRCALHLDVRKIGLCRVQLRRESEWVRCGLSCRIGPIS